MERLTRRDWSKYGFYDKETPILGARREYELYQRLGRYEDIGTLKECRAAMEKQTAKRPRIIGNAMICPSCPRCFKSASPTYCPSCGQMIDWGNEE